MLFAARLPLIFHILAGLGVMPHLWKRRQRELVLLSSLPNSFWHKPSSYLQFVLGPQWHFPVESAFVDSDYRACLHPLSERPRQHPGNAKGDSYPTYHQCHTHVLSRLFPAAVHRAIGSLHLYISSHLYGSFREWARSRSLDGCPSISSHRWRSLFLLDPSFRSFFLTTLFPLALACEISSR